jgi:DNA polymerase-1
MTAIFEQVVVADFEYEIDANLLPNVLCMVAHVLDENLQHVHTLRLWRGEFGRKPPFDIGPNTLFVAYSAWAEMTCFKISGWQFPVHIFDLHTAYLAASNILLPYNPDTPRKRPRKRLSDACRAYGIEGWEAVDKEAIATDIGEGRWQKYGRDIVFDYCEEDVRMSALLLRRQVRGYGAFPPANVARVLHWSNYSAKTIALIQSRGIPIDVPLWKLVQEHKAGVIHELLRQFDPSFDEDEPIYTADGEWSYERLERWLIRNGIYAWPRLDTGKLDTSGDAFRMMSYLPGVAGLHALRDSVGFIAKARLPIGGDSRNRPSLFPFGTLTGRNAHTRSPFNAHTGMRSFIVFPSDALGVYLDWRTQEVGIAAALSGDEKLMADYSSGDIYHSLARVCGFTNEPNPKQWKQDHPDMRQRMKVLQLAISYGMGVPSLAKGLDRHPLIASNVIERHRRTYPRFWQWRDDTVQRAMIDRGVESVFGWPLRLTTSPNTRTLCNFSAQSNGAEMLRLAAWRLSEAGIVPVMLIHDGILLEVANREQVEHAKEIMRQAGRDVCDGFEIDVDVDQMLVGGMRYADKRPMARKMWAIVMGALEKARAIPKRA